MSGHSRWAGIKHKKAIIDAKRGKVFTRINREIMVAAKHGGGKPENNPRLRAAIDVARGVNMPQDNIKKAIQRGTGELPGQTIEELTYEGYGPGGVAIYVEATSDNKNRTTADIRHIFSAHGGNMGEIGCVSYLFEQKGLITVQKSAGDEEKITNLAIEVGAEDIKTDEDGYEIVTGPAEMEEIKQKLVQAKIPIDSAEVSRIPRNTIPLSEVEAMKCLGLLEALEDHDDVKSTSANFDIPQEMMDKLSSAK